MCFAESQDNSYSNPMVKIKREIDKFHDKIAHYEYPIEFKAIGPKDSRIHVEMCCSCVTLLCFRPVPH